MVNYSKFHKTPDPMDFFFYQVFNLKIKRNELLNDIPLSFKSIKNHNIISKSLEYNSLIVDLPDKIMENLIVTNIKEPSHREFFTMDNSLYLPMTQYLPGDEYIIDDYLSKKDNYHITKPLSHKYLIKPNTKTEGQKLIDITGRFVLIFSAFIIINELINTYYNNDFSVKVDDKTISNLKKNRIKNVVKNKDGILIRKYNPVTKEMLRQYHEIDFPVYSHSVSLVELLTSLDFPFSAESPQFKTMNKNNCIKNVYLDQNIRVEDIVMAIDLISN